MIKNIRIGTSYVWRGHLWKVVERVKVPISHGPDDTYITLSRPGLGVVNLVVQFMSTPGSDEGDEFRLCAVRSKLDAFEA